jgi:hypothetical protein
MAGASQIPEKRGFFATLWRVVRQIFHETTGAMFLVLAFFWIVAAVRQWRSGAETWLLVVLGSFAVVLIFFGVTSFLSARRVR